MSTSSSVSSCGGPSWRSRSSRGLLRRVLTGMLVLTTLLVAAPPNAGAVTPGTYTVTSEMTVRLNPGGFVIGGLRAGDHIRWISGQSAPSNRTGKPGAHLYVRALGKVQRCGWIINDSTKLSSHTDGVGTCTNGFIPGSKTESRRQLVDSGIADLVNDYRYGVAIDAVDWGCPLRLSGPTALYRNMSAAADDVKGTVNATTSNGLPIFRWRYRVAGTNILLGYADSERAWGFIRIQPNQENKLLNTIDEPGSGHCPNSRSSVAWRVNV